MTSPPTTARMTPLIELGRRVLFAFPARARASCCRIERRPLSHELVGVVLPEVPEAGLEGGGKYLAGPISFVTATILTRSGIAPGPGYALPPVARRAAIRSARLVIDAGPSRRAPGAGVRRARQENHPGSQAVQPWSPTTRHREALKRPCARLREGRAPGPEELREDEHGP